MLKRMRQQIVYNNTSTGLIEAGSAVTIGAVFGVAPVDIQPKSAGILELNGTWSLPCAKTLTAEAGAVALWAGSKVVSSGSGKKIGYFPEAVTAGVTTVDVTLVPNLEVST